MIESIRAAQRVDLGRFAEGLTAWVRGEDSEVTDATAINVADVVRLVANYLTNNKWG